MYHSLSETLMSIQNVPQRYVLLSMVPLSNIARSLATVLLCLYPGDVQNQKLQIQETDQLHQAANSNFYQHVGCVLVYQALLLFAQSKHIMQCLLAI